MIYLDLFAGVGGFAKGLQDAGFKFSKHYYSEIDKYAMGVYDYQFKNSIYAGSVENVSGIEADIVTFGFPCQDLSIAGKGEGLDGERSSLFFEAMRIVDEARPRVFIFENVKGLLSNREGKDFEIVLKTIADIGVYDCEWQLLNTAWVLPQNRPRVFFVGHLRGKSTPKVFPFTEATTIHNRESGQDQLANCLDSNYHKGWLDKGQRTFIAELRTANCVTPDAYLTRGERKRDENGKAVLTSMHERRIRKFMPVECERLQGFPDNWTKWGLIDGKKIIISDTQRYRQMGNAVSVPMAKMIGKRLRA